MRPSTDMPPDGQDLSYLFESLMLELREGLDLYWRTAGDILSGSGVRLFDFKGEYLALERNLFSALFLYSYFRAGIPRPHRIFYVAVNQCLRGMVTGCDNLLDDEYKATLETDLPVSGRKFRSILDIMVSDRVLFEILIRFCSANGLSHGMLIEAGRASLASLTRSGAEEASEEAGIVARLPPEVVLTRIHHLKTGLLFLCPWAIPPIIEADPALKDTALTRALYQVGMGCQVMDDAVDLLPDLEGRRHNYVASLIEHGEDTNARRWLQEPYPGSAGRFFAEFPRLLAAAEATAWGYLTSGLSGLFAPEHQTFVTPTGRVIAQRIGFDRIASAVSEAR
jgi:hypothetical protein